VSKDFHPVSPILARFQQDLKLKGLSSQTQQSYVRAVRKFSEYLKREPDSATEDDVRNYLLFLHDVQQWEPSTINVAQNGLKHFFKLTCPRDWPVLQFVRVKIPLKLPVVLSIPEVHILLKLIEKPSMNCFFTVVYTLGLRLQEALHLEVEDIDSARMMVHIHRGKGAKDRYVPLPIVTLQVLREYYRSHRNSTFLFPSEGKDHLQASQATEPMSESSVQGCITKVLAQLKWQDRGISTHTLRHCYATHLLEAGVNLKLIQKYLGHAYLTSTMIYFHVTTVGEETAIAKINSIMKRKS
jgi:integrase/recombinase XerD